MSNNDASAWERITNDLVTLKNKSEMMIDLAYSAVLLNSKYLAEEVSLLEEQVDKLHLEFQYRVLSKTSITSDPMDLLGLIRLGSVTERIADSASEIAEVVLRGIEPHPIVQMVIQDADETVIRAEVSGNSSLVGKTLREARIAEKTGMWVLVIRRENKWIRPRPKTVLKTGDILIASGYSEGEEDFKQLLKGETGNRE